MTCIIPISPLFFESLIRNLMISFFTDEIIDTNADFLVGISSFAMSIPTYQRPSICLLIRVTFALI